VGVEGCDRRFGEFDMAAERRLAAQIETIRQVSHVARRDRV
jgi:hypothetical protein